MHRCLERIDKQKDRLSERMNALADKEKHLRRFACFKGGAVEDSPIRYFQIMASVISFVNDLHASWKEQEANPQVMADVQVALLRMAPMQVVFKRDEMNVCEIPLLCGQGRSRFSAPSRKSGGVGGHRRREKLCREFSIFSTQMSVITSMLLR